MIPESSYAIGQWARLPTLLRLLLRVNNTLAGRLVLGPAISAIGFFGSEAHRIRRREPGGARPGVHAGAIAAVHLFVSVLCGLPFWMYVVGAAYPGLSLLMLRTFAEHRASERISARTAIIEDLGLSLLFLNNNLHLVHHDHPRVPWYDLSALYRSRRDAFRDATGTYCSEATARSPDAISSAPSSRCRTPSCGRIRERALVAAPLGRGKPMYDWPALHAANDALATIAARLRASGCEAPSDADPPPCARRIVA